jgi:aldose 1-epimerase
MTDASPLSIGAGELRAEFLPASGMLGVSLRFRGQELLRRIEDLDAARRKGSTAGIPLLYPWANRLAALQYRAAGREAVLDPKSLFLHFDDQGLPMHGVPWSQLSWKIVEARKDSFLARLDWDRLELLAIFPFPHQLEIAGAVTSDSLTMETAVLSDESSPVPISFGFHPYFGIPHLARDQWHLQLPEMSKLRLDSRGIPTGEVEKAPPFDRLVGEQNFDDGFALLGDSASFALSGGGYEITVNFLRGYSHAQIFAPKGKDFLALEPMTAPTNALISQDGLRILEPGRQFLASFRITVQHAGPSGNLGKQS